MGGKVEESRSEDVAKWELALRKFENSVFENIDALIVDLRKAASFFLPNHMQHAADGLERFRQKFEGNPEELGANKKVWADVIFQGQKLVARELENLRAYERFKGYSLEEREPNLSARQRYEVYIFWGSAIEEMLEFRRWMLIVGNTATRFAERTDHEMDDVIDAFNLELSSSEAEADVRAMTADIVEIISTIENIELNKENKTGLATDDFAEFRSAEKSMTLVKQESARAGNLTDKLRTKLRFWAQSLALAALTRYEIEVSTIGQDDLEIGRQIGQGTFGEVFLAKFGGQDAVVKRLNLARQVQSARNEFALRMDLVREANDKSARFRHAGLVDRYGSACIMENKAWRFYLVMEKCDCSLGDLIDGEDASAALNFESLVNYFLDVASGTGFLHSKNIIHRDIKPHNILIKSGRAKLGDFGLVQHVSFETEEQLTENTHGTVAYAPPEARQPPGPYLWSKSGDIYCIGRTMYQAITFHRPPMRNGNVSLITNSKERQRILSTPDPALNWEETNRFFESGSAGEVERANIHKLETIADRCVKHHMEDRPTAGQLYDDIAQLL